MATYNGVRVTVLRSALGDCTNGGVTAKRDRFVLVSDIETPEIDLSAGGASTDNPEEVLVLIHENLSGPAYGKPWKYRCQPLAAVPKGSTGYMYGGNHVNTSDSRYPIDYSLPVHDRTETWAEYELYSR